LKRLVARVGILGGTFNPPHLGHLELARHAVEELQLDRVTLMPVARPPHKPAEEDPGPEHRLRMCRLLVADTERISVCALEVQRGGPSYTADTLQAIHASHPDAELTLILGADIAGTLSSWRDTQRVLELADIAVACREGAGTRDVVALVERLAAAPGEQGGAAAEKVRFLQMPLIAISSSLVRERVARGEPIEELVGPAVAAYIAEHGLYRSAVEARS
jgi:nicotinate-nucleotide adenylyltransferase